MLLSPAHHAGLGLGDDVDLGPARQDASGFGAAVPRGSTKQTAAGGGSGSQEEMFSVHMLGLEVESHGMQCL